jgi:Protein of unknown function (DUF3995)
VDVAPAPRARRTRDSDADAAVLVACAVGLVHAGFSLYWALGGRWLLPTVGTWAVDAVDRSAAQAGLLLGSVAAVKALAAVIPVAVAHDRLPWTRFWRGVCWVGGSFLVVYGGVNVVVSGVVLLGVVTPDGGYDREAMIGHALLWDPLFAIWGAALLVWLRLSSATTRVSRLR